MDQLVTLNRRELLKSTTGLLMGWVVAGSPLALIAPGRAWAVDLTAFTSSEGAALLSMARTIAPHDKLDDAAYALVIQSVDGDASKDANTLKMFKEGLASIGTSFAASSESERVEALEKIESSAFFQTMRVKILQVLYSNPIAYAYFGYEGEAFSKGVARSPCRTRPFWPMARGMAAAPTSDPMRRSAQWGQRRSRRARSAAVGTHRIGHRRDRDTPQRRAHGPGGRRPQEPPDGEGSRRARPRAPADPPQCP